MEKQPPNPQNPDPQKPANPLPTPRGEVSEYIHVTKLVLDEHAAKKPTPIAKLAESLSSPHSLKKDRTAMRVALIILGMLAVAAIVYVIWLR